MKHLALLLLPLIYFIIGALAESSGGGIRSLIPESLFNEMLKHKNEGKCFGGFYNYEAFVAAAESFPGFASTGDTETQKREIAAFFAQTSHETTGGWDSAPDGPYAWGYCFIREGGDPGDYCRTRTEYPCVPYKKYFGRGPFQLRWNDNYGAAGKAIGADLLNNPDLVIGDPTISFKTAIWFWMTPQTPRYPLSPKPSCHDVITGQWKWTTEDWRARRVPGFGMTTNVINGANECGGRGTDQQEANRIGFYTRYCSLLGTSPGDNLDCKMQRAYEYD